MKNIFLTIFLTLFAGNVYAFNLGDALKEAGKGPTESINKNLDQKIDKIVKKFEGKIDGKIEKYEKKIKEAEDALNKIKYIRDNAESYIRTAKIILAFLSSGILALIFVMWRIWRNIVSMKKVVKNVASYNDIEKRLKAVERKVGA